MAKKVDNRNLVVCETFDNFANKVDDIDFSVEDIVALVTSLSNVFYWLNVESVWGPIGFTWSQVDSHGVFNKTTIPFTIIPKLPDGYRIKKLDRTFDNITSDYIELRKSDWSNLTYVRALCPRNKTVNLDLTGAPIEGVLEGLVGENGESYIKGDFSKCTKIAYSGFGRIVNTKSVDNMSKLIVDNDNKYLNLPYNCDKANGCCYYKGEGPLKLEYFFNINPENYRMGYLGLYSENSQYYITNLENDRLFIVRANNITGNNISIIDAPLTEVTIDTKYLKDIDILSLLTAKDRVDTYFFKLKPLRYVGDIDSINAYHPFLYIEDEFPEYDEYLMSKLLPKTEGDLNIYIMPYIIFKHLVKCPYTIDLQGKDVCRIFKGHDWNEEVYPLIPLTKDDVLALGGVKYSKGSERYYIDILPTFINADHELKYFETFGYELKHDSSVDRVLWKLPSFRAQECYFNGCFIDKDTIIQISKKSDWSNYTFCILEDLSSTHIILFPADDGTISFTLSGFTTDDYNDNRIVDFIQFESLDETMLKSSTINTLGAILPGRKKDWVIRHPIVICNFKFIVTISPNIESFESEFIFIYKTNISFTSVKDDNYIETVRKFIAGIQPNDSTNEYKLTLKSNLYNQLTDEEKNHIINDLNYILVNQI